MFSLSQLQFSPPIQWRDFESLCHEVFRAEWDDFHSQKHGRPGHRQQGVDVYGRSAYHNGYAGVQCKCRDLLVRRGITESQLLDEVAEAKKFKPPLKQFTIATTLRRNPRHQQWARDITERHRREDLFSVHVLSWDDITEMLAAIPRLLNSTIRIFSRNIWLRKLKPFRRPWQPTFPLPIPHLPRQCQRHPRQRLFFHRIPIAHWAS